MIPPFDATGNLPPGIHAATWGEFVERYGLTSHRLTLLAGLKAALDVLRIAGCQRVFIITTKVAPGDYDACWEIAGVDPDALDPTLLTFANQRAAQKAKYGGELFPAETAADPVGTRFLEFFQRDKQTGDLKGIVAIDLGGLP